MRQVHSLFIGIVTLALLLALAPTPANASTGSVYYDQGENVAAGAVQFNGTLTGLNNVGFGYDVMPSLTTGNGNIAVGNGSLNHVTSGLRNVSIDGLYYTTTGSDNVASGFDALNSNSSGDGNIASGLFALSSNTSGNYNVASGYQALRNSTGNQNIGLGPNAGINLTTGSRNIDIANPGAAGESGTIRIGSAANQDAAFIAGVSGKTLSGPTKAVVVNAKGRLGTAPAPAAPLNSQARTISHLRAQVRQQGAEIARLRELVRRRTG
jgi:hypothetical protein